MRVVLLAVTMLLTGCATTSALSSKRVAVFIDEKREAEPLATAPSAEAAHHFTSAIVGALSSAGWEVVELTPLGVADPTGAAAAKAAREKGAAWAVTGNARFKSMAVEGQGILPVGSVFPVLGEYDVRLIEVENVAQLATSTGKLNPSSKKLPVISYDRTATELVETVREEIVAPIRDALAATKK
ncbi:MAG: hypothetical protein QM817_30660 [Archangium sp.]